MVMTRDYYLNKFINMKLKNITLGIAAIATVVMISVSASGAGKCKDTDKKLMDGKKILWCGSQVELTSKKADLEKNLKNAKFAKENLALCDLDSDFKKIVKDTLKTEYNRQKKTKENKQYDFDINYRPLLYGVLSKEVKAQDYKATGKITDTKLFQDLILNK